MTAIEVQGLTVALDATRDPVVEDVSLSAARGEVLGVVGESGSGKSTLALAMLAYATPGAEIIGGRVACENVDLLSLSAKELRRARRNVVGFVPQDPATALNPALPVGGQITERMGRGAARDRSRITALLGEVGLPTTTAFLRRRPRQLSGGQQQRVAIAMAAATRPRAIVFDEPTTGLDVATQATVLNMVSRLCAANEMTAIYISHDLAVVGSVADSVAVMYGGRIVEYGAAQAVLDDPLHPYTRALLDAAPSTTEQRRLVPILGQAPKPGARASGCTFAPRCSFATQECRTREPELSATGSGRHVRCVHTQRVQATPRERRRLEPVQTSSADGSAVLSVRELSAHHGGLPALSDVSFDVHEATCLAIVGESGSGKTTMSRCLIGLHEGQQGSVLLRGKPLSARARDRAKEHRRDVQYVFQNPFGSLNPRRTVAASIEMPLRHFDGVGGKAARRQVVEVLDRVGIARSAADLHPGQLSGGQQQRVALARSLVCQPSVLICDEVTSALDVSVQAQIVELLRELVDDGLGMIFVTHDLALVRSIAENTAVLSGGRVVETGPTERVFTEPSDPYTRTLLAETLEVDSPRTGTSVRRRSRR